MTTDTGDVAHACCGPGYASPKAAMQAPREKLLYTIGLYTGTKVDAPDYLATVDVDPASSSYGREKTRTTRSDSRTSQRSS